MNKKKGMTLIEVLIASVIVGVIAVGMLGIFVVAKKTTYKTGDKIVALGDMRTIILEKITKEGYNFADIKEKAMTAYAGFVSASDPYGSLTGEGWEIDELNASGAEVGWTDNTKGICTGAVAATNYINYCYKPVKFTVEWTER